MHKYKKSTLILIFTVFFLSSFRAQTAENLKKEIEQLQQFNDNQDHQNDQLAKMIDVVLRYQKASDISYVNNIIHLQAAKMKRKKSYGKRYR